jgi:hypothetical protein
MSVTEENLRTEGYRFVRQLPNGRWIGIMQMNFTWGLFVGLDETGWYSYRYCYKNLIEAVTDSILWNGEDNPPGKWIVRKGLGGDLHNPRDDL